MGGCEVGGPDLGGADGTDGGTETIDVFFFFAAIRVVRDGYRPMTAAAATLNELHTAAASRASASDAERACRLRRCFKRVATIAVPERSNADTKPSSKAVRLLFMLFASTMRNVLTRFRTGNRTTNNGFMTLGIK